MKRLKRQVDFYSKHIMYNSFILLTEKLRLWKV